MKIPNKGNFYSTCVLHKVNVFKLSFEIERYYECQLHDGNEVENF